MSAKVETKKQFKTPHEKKVEAKDTKPTKPTPKPAKVRHGKLGSLLGHSVLSVVRAMGLAGWTVEDARAALVRAGITPAEHSLRVGIKRGKQNDGSRRIAPLSAAELNTLKATPAKATAKKKGKV